ncbi:hypothetical protein BC332_25497 [Capsicum chinense]|nr:hypothetical protein BC332_25497 [Capsicum chinense]
MRLSSGKVTDRKAAKITTFDKWLLQIRDGSFYDDVNNELIKFPPDICITSSNDPIDSIVESVYPSLLQNYNDPAYLKERAILTPKNEMVQELNDTIMKMIPGEGRIYFSSDNICKASVNTNDEDLLYPPEFLNGLRFPGIPNHDIHLKVTLAHLKDTPTQAQPQSSSTLGVSSSVRSAAARLLGGNGSKTLSFIGQNGGSTASSRFRFTITTSDFTLALYSLSLRQQLQHIGKNLIGPQHYNKDSVEHNEEGQQDEHSHTQACTFLLDSLKQGYDFHLIFRISQGICCVILESRSGRGTSSSRYTRVPPPPVPLSQPFVQEIGVGAHDMNYVEAQENYGIEEENEVDAVDLDEDDENIGETPAIGNANVRSELVNRPSGPSLPKSS